MWDMLRNNKKKSLVILLVKKGGNAYNFKSSNVNLTMD